MITLQTPANITPITDKDGRLTLEGIVLFQQMIAKIAELEARIVVGGL